MKDPHEHSDMPHESEDVRKRDCRKYKELYGKHLVAGVIYIKAILIIPNPTTGSAGSRIFLFIATYSNTQV